jgi:hypothetical protein
MSAQFRLPTPAKQGQTRRKRQGGKLALMTPKQVIQMIKTKAW